MQGVAPGSRILVDEFDAGADTIPLSLSDVAWGAVIAGAFAAAATTIVLVALGAGLGLASVSPWTRIGASATAFSVTTAIWLIVVQWLSSGLGGYLAGRMRARWAGVHGHEVYFRDTAHGFLAWAVASVLGAALFAFAASSVVGRTAQVSATVASGAAQGAGQAAAGRGNAGNPDAYFTDMLFRPDANANGNAQANPVPANPRPANPQATQAEAGLILATGLRNGGDVSDPDKAYLAQMVAARTGLSQADAQNRVNDVVGQAKAAELKARQAADAARKAAASLSIFMALSMMVGAFIAAAAAALGGIHRDEWPSRLAAMP